MDDRPRTTKSIEMVRLVLFHSWSDRIGLRFILLSTLIAGSFLSNAQCDSTARKTTCEIRDSAGHVIEKRIYKKGERHGYWRYFDSEGHILRVVKYRKGQRRMTFIYNEKERIIRTINRSGRIRERNDCNCGK